MLLIRAHIHPFINTSILPSIISLWYLAHIPSNSQPASIITLNHPPPPYFCMHTPLFHDSPASNYIFNMSFISSRINACRPIVQSPRFCFWHRKGVLYSPPHPTPSIHLFLYPNLRSSLSPIQPPPNPSSSLPKLPLESLSRFASQLSNIFPTSLNATGFVRKRSIPLVNASL